MAENMAENTERAEAGGQARPGPGRAQPGACRRHGARLTAAALAGSASPAGVTG